MTRRVIERGEECIRRRKRQKAVLIKTLPVFSISLISLAAVLSLYGKNEASVKSETENGKNMIQFSSQTICTSDANTLHTDTTRSTSLTESTVTNVTTEETTNSFTTVTELSNKENTHIQTMNNAVYTDIEQNDDLYTTTTAPVVTTTAMTTRAAEAGTVTETVTTELEERYPACMGNLQTVMSDFVSDNGVFVPAGSIEVTVYIGRSISFKESYLFKEIAQDLQLICDSNGFAAYNTAPEFKDFIFDISISDDGSKLIISSVNSDVSPANCIMLKFYTEKEIDISEDNVFEIANLK